MPKKLNAILIIIIIAVLAAASLAIWRWTREIEPAQAEQAVFRAAQSDQGGVDINSAFTLTFDQRMSSASVNRSLSVEPEIALGVHQGASPEEVLIAPAEPLAAGAVYRFILTAGNQRYSWAVQTKSELKVSSHSPADRSVGVAVDMPLDIVLNQMLDIDLSRMDEFCRIRPETNGVWSQSGRTLRFIPDQPWQAGVVYSLDMDAGLPAAHSSLTLAQGLSFAFETAPAADQQADWYLSGSAALLSSDIPSFRLDGAVAPAIDGIPQVQAQLFCYADGESYAAALTQIMEDKPVWSRGFKFLRNCPIANASPQGLPETLPLAENNGGYTLQWINSLPQGYYLLRIFYHGQSRDALFAVSDISVYLNNDPSHTLLWLHDPLSGQPIAATVRDLSNGVTAIADAQGVAQLDYAGGAGLYAVEYEGRTLILPLWEDRSNDGPARSSWRYLYTDKNVYANGETLRYWGLLEPRGGWELEYENVSVYLLDPGGGADDHIFKDITALNNGLFNGSITLPRSREGAYSLQIWQSGVPHISADIYISDSGEVDLPEPAAPQPGLPPVSAAISGRSRLETDSDSYAIGQSFGVSGYPERAGWLFIEAEQGIKSVSAGDSGLYLGAFQPLNGLNSYVLAVGTDGARYYPTEQRLLSLDHSGLSVNIQLTKPSMLRRGESAELQLAITDAQGQPLSNAAVAVQIFQGEEPTVDTLAAIYNDYNTSGLATESLKQPQTPLRAGETALFSVITTDEQGLAAFTMNAPMGAGGCWLIAQCISDDIGTVRAGSLVQRLALTGAPTAEEEESPEQATRYSYSSGLLEAGQTVNIKNGDLLILTAPQRLQILELLLSALSDRGGDGETLLSAAHSRQLLIDYGGDELRALLGQSAFDAGAYQKPNGGLGEPGGLSDLPLSLKAAALASPGLAWHDLIDYFQSTLDSYAATIDQRAAALAGLASAGKPVLTEARMLLESPELDEASYWWLLWALYCCGDRQTVLSHYYSGIFPITAAADPDGAHVLIAAACGDREAALSLLAAHPNELSAERVLTARLLLTRTTQPELGYSYLLDSESREGRISGLSDQLLFLNDTNTSFTLTEAEGELAYALLRVY